ncbi:tyrosine-type recombinase/integrase [Streptomyces sp. NPDC086549]|uniref:tyrosine-type recombinase/integrase n=1 Tax=Streptomyces sp. NPDC086549 TaxID=3365752 RepID=UPI0038138899
MPAQPGGATPSDPGRSSPTTCCVIRRGWRRRSPHCRSFFRLRSVRTVPLRLIDRRRPQGDRLPQRPARRRRLSEEAGVPRGTDHDLRHLAATITITAGVRLTVVSKALRHSTLSTTANLYSHLTQQAARQAVDTIDHTLTTTAARAADRPPRQAWLRPPRDHIHRLREALHKLHSPAPPATGTTASQPKLGRATTPRPPHPRTPERPLSHG